MLLEVRRTPIGKLENHISRDGREWEDFHSLSSVRAEGHTSQDSERESERGI